VNQLLPKLIKIEEQNGQILAYMKQKGSAPKFTHNFPLKTLEELVQLDNELTNETTAQLVCNISYCLPGDLK